MYLRDCYATLILEFFLWVSILWPRSSRAEISCFTFLKLFFSIPCCFFLPVICALSAIALLCWGYVFSSVLVVVCPSTLCCAWYAGTIFLLQAVLDKLGQFFFFCLLFCLCSFSFASSVQNMPMHLIRDACRICFRDLGYLGMSEFWKAYICLLCDWLWDVLDLPIEW